MIFEFDSAFISPPVRPRETKMRIKFKKQIKVDRSHLVFLRKQDFFLYKTVFEIYKKKIH
ncbi:hypothetical protein EHR08_05775 [Leptospira bandrabouensis]|uniref:Uncharacterized protein n=1 Tax=Leptospira bandrabouensis TaxID=2484903 RepID=A0A6H3NZT3_9LEPT|nr:hypothetical protein EHR07_12860 [Leptospira bandrabouensis]TGN15794.1 hypothetical protein EHR08_05775 [Leptospira bandrabouensis]